MEKWTRWEPTSRLSGKYYLETVVWLEKGLIIKLSQGDQKIELLFDGYIDAFRSTNESFYFKTFSDLSKQYGDEFYADWSFFKIANSEYLKWLSEKSCTWSDQFPFIHFCILGGDQIVEILVQYEPIVTVTEHKPDVKIE